MATKYYIIAGEASGDLHGSNLIKELHKLKANTDFRVWGGDKMQAAGASLVKHYKELAFMGFAEVIKNLPTIFKNLKFCKEDILKYKPTALILIDYPGFNLRIAKWAKQNDLKVIYYISPQVWAWKESRVKDIKKYVDKMLVILPFEKDFYKKWDYDVEYVGHPLVEVIESFKLSVMSDELSDTSDELSVMSNDIELTTNHKLPTANLIALLPGSRKQELRKKLPIMLQVAQYYPEYEFIVAKAPGVEDEFYDHFLSPFKNVRSVSDQTYSLLLKAQAALVTSGTATLETALFGVPEIVCYKGSTVSYQIAKRLIKLKFISLVNIIMNKEVVKELIQDELTVNNLKKELHELLTNFDRRKQLEKNYNDLKNLLRLGGNASANAARSINEFLNH